MYGAMVRLPATSWCTALTEPLPLTLYGWVLGELTTMGAFTTCTEPLPEMLRGLPEGWRRRSPILIGRPRATARASTRRGPRVKTALKLPDRLDWMTTSTYSFLPAKAPAEGGMLTVTTERVPSLA